MNESVGINIGWLFIIIVVVSLIVYILYLRGTLHIRKLNIAFLNGYVDDLEKEKARLSNALREKGIEVDRLEKKIKRLEEGK